MRGLLDEINEMVEREVERRVSERRPPPSSPSASAASSSKGHSNGESGLGPWHYKGHPDQPFGAVTYSQFGEDHLILNLLYLLGIRNPTFLDVGAHHPVNCNNTALLYSQGHRGISVEPNLSFKPLYEQLRPEDRLLTVGVGPATGTIDYYMIDDFSGRNTFNREVAEEFVRAYPQFSIREVRKIPVVTLDSIIDNHCEGRWPDLFCIDAEGLDLAIIRSSRLQASPGQGPAVVCVEYVSGANHDESSSLATELIQRGYEQAARTIGNQIFIRKS
jgi:FkbM family methyltransferase